MGMAEGYNKLQLFFITNSIFHSPLVAPSPLLLVLKVVVNSFNCKILRGDVNSAP